MKQLIGIYATADWSQVEQFADNLRAAGDCAVRVRNGALFTPDQHEEFDTVYVHGDFPAVRAAYPDAKNIGNQKQAEKASDEAHDHSAKAANASRKATK